LLQLLPYLHPKGKTPSEDCGKEISSGASISETESVHRQVCIFLFCWIRLYVGGEFSQRARFSVSVFCFYFKVCLLERRHTLLDGPIVASLLEHDLLGRSIRPFLFPCHSTDRSTQTEIRNRNMSNPDALKMFFIGG
jgi:hypothetical protein